MKTAPLFLASVAFLCLIASAYTDDAVRETILDNETHIEKDIVLDIPNPPPLCAGMTIFKQSIPIASDAGACSLYVEKEGEGVPMVLLHGGPGCTHHLFHPAFSRAARFAQVVYYDQRGCGASDYGMPENGYSVMQAADDLDALRAALNIERWIVLGHSYGGTLAQYYAAKYPDRVIALVLVSSATYGLPIQLRPTRQNRFISSEEAQKIQSIWKNTKLSETQQVFNAHLNGDWKRQNFFRPTTEELARMALYEWKHSDKFRAQTCQSLNTIDFQEEFNDFPLPVLIMEGKWDLTWNTDKPEKLKSCFPAAKLVLFEKSGHNPFADEPALFFAALEEFVAALPAIPEDNITQWKKRAAEHLNIRDRSAEAAVNSAGWGRASSAKIAAKYTSKWLTDFKGDLGVFLRIGFALYDAKRYEDAFAAFGKMAESDDLFRHSIGRLWQGQMLDLMGKRDEAIAIYTEVAAMKSEFKVMHDQYGLSYTPSACAAERIETPFQWIENKDAE